MGTWKQDRVYAFICSGLISNSHPDIRFFFDKEDFLFFNLHFADGEFKVHTRKPLELTVDLKKKLQKKIDKVTSNSSDIIEINKLDKIIHFDLGKPAKNPEDYKQKMENEKALFTETQNFLDRNQIDISKVDVIE